MNPDGNNDTLFDIKYPKVGWPIFFIATAIAFFKCGAWNEYLQELILPYLNWWMLKALAKTAILMSYLILMTIGVLLIRLKYALFEIAGLFFVGIGLGIIFRIVLIFAAVLNPYRF